MENKQQESEGSSIFSDLEDQLNLADFALDEFEAKSNDGNAGEIEKIKSELVEMKKEMQAMKLSSRKDSNEIDNKLDADYLEKYVIDHLQKLAQQENQKVEEVGRNAAMGMKDLKKMLLMEKKSKLNVNSWMEDESMEEKLAKMEEAMFKLEEKIGRKNEKLAEKDEEICALEVEMAYLKQIIGEKDTKIGALEEEIAELKGKKAVDQQSNAIKISPANGNINFSNAKPTKASPTFEDVNKMELSTQIANAIKVSSAQIKNPFHCKWQID